MALNPSELEGVSEVIARVMGLAFPPHRWPELQRGLAAAAASRADGDVRSLVDGLLSTAPPADLVAELARHLTVGETYFFRDPTCFQLLRERVLPSVVEPRRGKAQVLRIWSAACCTGEEAYSIAIVLRECLPDWKDWQIDLLATDLNPDFLEHARRGVYGNWSFRNTPKATRDRWFTGGGGGSFVISDELRRMVKFVELNLVEGVYRPIEKDGRPVDIIVCRNALMYFSPEMAGRVVRHLGRCQVANGWLAMGPSEFLRREQGAYGSPAFEGATWYRKREPAQAAHTGPAMPRAAQVRAPSGAQGGAQGVAVKVPVPVTGSTAPSLTNRRERAEELYNKGLYADAIAAVDEGGEGAPGAHLLALKSKALANSGRLEEALSSCEAWVRADRFEPRAYYLQSVVLRELGRVEEAGELLRKALYVDPSFALAHFALGTIAGERGEPVIARRHFENALAALERFPSASTLSDLDGMSAGRLAEIIQRLMAEVSP